MATVAGAGLAPPFTFLDDHRLEGPHSFLGEWRVRGDDPSILIKSPVDGSDVARVAAFTRAEVDQVFANAAAAQRAWAKQSIDFRAQALHRFAAALEAHTDFIVDILMAEIAKSRRDSREEVTRSADLINFTAEEGRRMSGDLYFGDAFHKGKRGKLGLSQRVPLGVVLAIPPYNYPINLAVSKIAPALVTGNAVVLKPPTQGAFCGLVLAAAAAVAGLPEGVFQVVTGRGSEIGDYLVTHPAVSMVSFTGSTETGMRLAQQVGMVPLQLELGGKDAAIVLSDADLDRAAAEIIAGAFAYSGQRCTAVKRVLVTEPVADTLVEKIRAGVENLKVGRPQDDANITPLIDEQTAVFVEGLISDAIAKGAKPHAPIRREGNLMYPSMVDYVTPDMSLAWEEPFGPVLPILRVRDAADAVRLANMSRYGLQAAVFTQDIERALMIADELEVGTVHINGRPARGPDHFPFLGVKASGMGTQGVRASMESMTRVKSVVFNLKESIDLQNIV